MYSEGHGHYSNLDGGERWIEGCLQDVFSRIENGIKVWFVDESPSVEYIAPNSCIQLQSREREGMHDGRGRGPEDGRDLLVSDLEGYRSTAGLVVQLIVGFERHPESVSTLQQRSARLGVVLV